MPGSKLTSSNILFQENRISFSFCTLAATKPATLIVLFPRLTHGGVQPLPNSEERFVCIAFTVSWDVMPSNLVDR